MNGPGLALFTWALFIALFGWATLAAAVREIRTRLRWRKAVRTAKTFWVDAEDATLDLSDHSGGTR